MQEFYDCHGDFFIHWIKDQWGICFKCLHADFQIQGSPERTLSRIVFESEDKRLYLIEKFPAQKFTLRNKVALSIEYVNQNGLAQALTYQKSRNNEFLSFYKGACYQISRFLNSTGIQRPQYLNSAGIGESFARFLVKLSKCSNGIEKRIEFQPFSLKPYIYKLFRTMHKYNVIMFKRYLPYLNYLEKEFMDIHDNFRLAYCHGDLHPLNVIWRDEKILAVIDWEFTGIKPDIYDAANLVGCAGIENPDGLTKPMVLTFIDQMKHNRLFNRIGWKYFTDYVLALRFAWLSEWLRKKDYEMLDMEAAYMKILVDNMDDIRKGWGIHD